MSISRWTSGTLVALTLLPMCAHAQSDAPTFVRGVVISARGAAVPGADAFLLETMEGTAAGADGRFSIRTRERDSVTLVLRHLGFRPVHRRALPGDTSITVILEPQAASLTPFLVQAGSYTAGDDRRASLTALRVATTPGATADVARAIQTLPGVQNVDEGTGLFVRGGDVTETKVLLNEAVMLSPYNYETPTGNFTTTVNPFLLEGIFFSSGGFGARYGNILSGVADLHTQGRPSMTSVTGVAGLAAISGGVALSLPHGVGVHATATRSDTDLLFKLNGSTHDYVPPPNGRDLSGSVIWNYRATGELRTFAIDRTNTLGIAATDPASAGGYASDSRTTMTQAGWKDLFGRFAPAVSLSYAEAHRDELFGPFALGTVDRLTQLFVQTAWSPRDGRTVRVGGDVDWRDSRFDGALPGASRGPLFDSRTSGGRNGEFIEADLRLTDRLRIVSGLRSDRASLSTMRTLDPRLSAAYQLAEDVALTAAWGVYHQVADPLYYDSSLGEGGLAPMRSTQAVIGVQAGRGEGAKSPIARLELYDKRYDDLAQLARDRTVVGNGSGSARGADLFLRGSSHGVGGRIAVSYVDSRRTDPNTGVLARAPFDVTCSGTAVLDVALPAGWSASGAYRYATGKPFTPVVGATRDAVSGIWTPIHGASFGERIPAFTRVDLSLSHYQRLSPRTSGVFFISLGNAFDRSNVYQYRYSDDYSRRIAIRSLFNRSVYVGGSLTHTPN